MGTDRRAVALMLATALAVPAEGLRQYAYYDPPGILTVCWGSTTDVVRGKKYSLDECKARLNADMLRAIDTVERCVPGLPEKVLAAFADAVYNLGPKVACDTRPAPLGSTPARMLAAGNLVFACDGLELYNKARIAGVLVPLPGLTKRRAAERELCLSGLA